MSDKQAAEDNVFTELNLDDLSLDDIRTLADKDVITPEEETPIEHPPAPAPAPQKTVHRRVIDLGDGAGTEVFEADSVEALLDKIVEAKKHASKKIREQQQKLREIEETQSHTNDDEEFLYSQQLMAKPTEAFKQMFKKMTGCDISEFKTIAERNKAMEVAQAKNVESQRQEEASLAFMQAHPEYLANEANGKRLVREINSLIGEAKAAGRDVDYAAVLEQAYTGLKNDGMLQLKSEEQEPAPAKATPTVTAPAAPAPRRASSIASRAPVVSTPRNTEPTEEELETMPLDRLRELAERASRQ